MSTQFIAPEKTGSEKTPGHAGHTATPDRRRKRSRTIRAILAGGLVLGVGAAVTLAAWNDSEFATGTFKAGVFNLEGSTDNTAFSDHNPAGSPSGPNAVLTFTTPAALAPGDVVAAPFAVRLAAGTTNNASVSVAIPTTTGAVTGLTYEIVRVAAGTTCAAGTADSTGTSLVPALTAVTATSATTFSLTKGATLAVAGTSQLMCIKVTAGSGLVQNQSGTITWQFTASSV